MTVPTMSRSPNSVCLTMIVRDEAHVIARAVESVRGVISAWAIVDTGSTDNTEDVARKALEGIPGIYTHRAWNGFGDARTASLELAREVGEDYALVLDADDIAHGHIDRCLTAPAYGVWMIYPRGARMRTHRLLRLDLPWRYVGKVDEYPWIDDAWNDELTLESLTLSTPSDGASSLDPDKWRRKALAIGEALVEEPSNSRYVFHLAMAWRNAGDDERALRHYLQRVEMGPGINWEEIYISWLEAGRAFERLGQQHKSVDCYLRAHAEYPERWEAPRELARIFSWRASMLPPVGGLFVEAKS